MRKTRMLAISAVAAMGLAACAPGSSPSTPTDPTALGSAPPVSQTTPAEASPAMTPTPAASQLKLTKGGVTSEFIPANVYCKGSPGNLVHLIAKGANGLPIVEVSLDFAMVKLDQRGAPDKSTSRPSGISVTGRTMTFEGVTIGAVAVSGGLTCSSLEAS